MESYMGLNYNLYNEKYLNMRYVYCHTDDANPEMCYFAYYQWSLLFMEEEKCLVLSCGEVKLKLPMFVGHGKCM